MQDGRTRKVNGAVADRMVAFLEQNRTTLTLVSGLEAGTEWALEGMRSVAGRSSKVEIQLDDSSVSSEHAAFELGEAGFGVRDLASTNGVFVNGKAVASAALRHGDRVRLGDCELQYVVESRPAQPRAWSVEEDA